MIYLMVFDYVCDVEVHLDGGMVADTHDGSCILVQTYATRQTSNGGPKLSGKAGRYVVGDFQVIFWKRREV